jgi:hypothetical protein
MIGTTHRLCKLHCNLGRADEGLVEIFDRSLGLLGSFVADITYPPMRNEFRICDIAACSEVGTKLGFRKCGG